MSAHELVRPDGAPLPPGLFVPAVGRSGPLYVSRSGAYKLGNGGPVMAHHKSRAYLRGADGVLSSVCLKRVFAATFAPFCEGGYARTDSVRYTGQAGDPLDPSLLSWARRPDRNGGGCAKVSTHAPEGESWKFLEVCGLHISDKGRYRRHDSENIMEFSPGRAGRYHRVSAYGKQYLFHRLVATAFLGHPVGDCNMVDHRDGDVHNNCPSNLSWVNASDNNKNRRFVLRGRRRVSNNTEEFFRAIVPLK